MTSLKVNNFVPTTQPLKQHSMSDPNFHNPEENQFTKEQLQSFQDMQKINEPRAFTQILNAINSKDLSESEKSIIREELQTQNSMIMMIFRFFLQSNEYQFFIRRLKNVAMTKVSLKQLRSNENILNQRQEDRPSGGYIGGVNNKQIDDNSTIKPSTLDYSRPPATTNNSAGVKQTSMFQTPQKNTTKKTQFLSNMESSEQERKLTNQNGRQQSSSAYNGSSTQISNFSKLQSSVKESNQQNSKLGGSSSQQRPPLVQRNNVLNQRDDFYFKKTKCYKGQNTIVYKHPSNMDFSQALKAIQNLGIDVQQMQNYLKEEQPSARIGPNILFKEVNEASGGITPPIQVQSDSDSGTNGNELTPTYINTEQSYNRHQINSLSPQLNQRQSYDLQTLDLSNANLKSIFCGVDSAYVINILRHQASKNHNKIEEDDLTLCLQIVSRKSITNTQIKKEVSEFFNEIIESNKLDKRTFNQKENRYVLFEEMLGPITLKTLLTRESFNADAHLRKCFDCFRQQNASKLISNDEMLRFISSTVQFIVYKVPKTVTQDIIKQVLQINSEYLVNKTIHYESSKVQQELSDWLSKHFGNQRNFQTIDQPSNHSKTFFDYSRSHSNKDPAYSQHNSQMTTIERTSNIQINSFQRAPQNLHTIQTASSTMLKSYNMINIQNSGMVGQNNRPQASNANQESRIPQKELQASNYEVYSQHNSSQFSTSLTNNNQVAVQRPASSHEKTADQFQEQQQQKFSYQKPSSANNSRFFNNYTNDQQQNNTYEPNSIRKSQNLYPNSPGKANAVSMTLQQIQNENILNDKANKAQKTYTLGFSGGLIENLNMQQNIYREMLQKQRQSNGNDYADELQSPPPFSRQSQSQQVTMIERENNSLNSSGINEVIKLKPTLMSHNTSQSDLSEKFSNMGVHEKPHVNVFNVRRY
ncbi:UNKNOWN [Stylonychia lemnae]|uniref:Uncharacterized protein n=1 Tax=Stylonychia lemnae TaxID=5949 RepID=A0A077ZVY5_STYLE|nr:UNKNOWN [Stylonychia lemnae]|eukprot:CDW72601.1 UNKNOWN [Stylonychia lemnae]